MSPVSPTPNLPHPLHEFPWHDKVYTWDTGSRLRSGEYEIRIDLWYTPTTDKGRSDAHEYVRQAMAQHLVVWKWLEERFEFWFMPELRFEGQGGHKPGESQEWSRTAVFGTFRLGRSLSSSA